MAEKQDFSTRTFKYIFCFNRWYDMNEILEKVQPTCLLSDPLMWIVRQNTRNVWSAIWTDEEVTCGTPGLWSWLLCVYMPRIWRVVESKNRRWKSWHSCLWRERQSKNSSSCKILGKAMNAVTPLFLSQTTIQTRFLCQPPNVNICPRISVLNAL